MPRKRRVARQRRAWTIAQERQLLHGWNWNIEGETFGDIKTDPRAMEGAPEAWGELKEEPLAGWIEKYPGSRPFMWWVVDATERRLPIDGKVHPFDNPERIGHVAKIASGLRGKVRARYLADVVALTKGLPRCWCIPSDWGRRYESEGQYLQRLGQLTPREVQLLAQKTENVT